MSWSGVFDGRELAVMAWLTVVVAWLVIWPKTRPGIGRIVRTAASHQIASVLGLMVLYVAGTVAGLLYVNVLTTGLIGGAVFWFFGPATILFFRTQHAGEDPHFFRRAVLSTLSVTALVGFLIGFYSMGFLAEFLLIPVWVLLACLLAVSATKPEFKPVQALLNWVLGAVVVAALGYMLVRVSGNPSSFANLGTLRGFVLPIVLTTAFIPFLYCLAVFTVYSGLFTWLRWVLRSDDALRRRTKRSLLRACGLRLRSAQRAATAPWVELLSISPTNRDVDQLIRHLGSARPHALATSVAAEDKMTRIVAEEAPGWEYLLFAARLEAGQLMLESRHDAYECDALPKSYDRAHDRAATGKFLTSQFESARNIVEQLGVVFAEDALADVFGDPGEPGNPQRIRLTAETIITVYERMLAWGEAVGAMNTAPECVPLVHEASQMVRQPLDEIRRYIGDWENLANDR